MLKLIKNFIKRKYWGSEISIRDLTQELFDKQRRKMDTPSYRKWLRHHYTLFSANALERKAHKMPIPSFWIGKLRLLEKELEDAEKLMGNPQVRKKMSDELSGYEKIVD